MMTVMIGLMTQKGGQGIISVNIACQAWQIHKQKLQVSDSHLEQAGGMAVAMSLLYCVPCNLAVKLNLQFDNKHKDFLFWNEGQGHRC
jgi:hypothetical protein